MKLCVIGATGPTGLLVVKEALEQGHEVKAVVRNPDKLTTQHEQLKVLKADLTQTSDLTEHFRGSDAVLSAIGGQAGVFTPCDVYTTIGTVAVDAMRQAGVSRLICVTSWGTKDDPNLPFILRWVLKPTFLRNGIKNMGEFEDFLSEKCSDINYTVVRPPRLTNEPSQGFETKSNEGQTVIGHTHAMSRQDVAKFMLSCLTSDVWDRKMVAIDSSSSSS